MNDIFKNGDRVYHYEYGWGTYYIDPDHKYSLLISFDNIDIKYPRCYSLHILLGLSFTEYKINQERPAPEYIPFTFEDRDLFLGKKIIPKSENPQAEAIVTQASKNSIYSFHQDKEISYKLAFDCFTFADGTPFGKLKN